MTLFQHQFFLVEFIQFQHNLLQTYYLRSSLEVIMENQHIKVYIKLISNSKLDQSQQKDRDKLVDISSNRKDIILKAYKDKVLRKYSYDYVFKQTHSYKIIYDSAIFPIIQHGLQSFNSTIFLYCDKSQFRKSPKLSQIQDEFQYIINAYKHIYYHNNNQKNKQYLVQCSCISIINEQIKDLMNNNKVLQIKQTEKQHEIYLKDVSKTIISSIQQINQLISTIRRKRIQYSQQKLNIIFTFELQICQQNEQGSKVYKNTQIKFVLINNIFLKEDKKLKDRSIEGLAYVEQMLFCKQNTQISFQQTKLTYLLKNALNGSQKVLKFYQIQTTSQKYNNILKLLNSAKISKSITLNPKRIPYSKSKWIKSYKKQIIFLKQMLSTHKRLKQEQNIKIKNDKRYKTEVNQQKQINLSQSQQRRLKNELQKLQKYFTKNLTQINIPEHNKLTQQPQTINQNIHDSQFDKIIQTPNNSEIINQKINQLQRMLKQQQLQNIQLLKQKCKLNKNLNTQIRTLQLQLSKYQGIVNILFQKKQINEILCKSILDQSNNRWIIDPMSINENENIKNLNLPKIRTSIHKPMKDSKYQQQQNKQTKQCSIKNIIKQARNSLSSLNKQDKKISKSQMIKPIVLPISKYRIQNPTQKSVLKLQKKINYKSENIDSLLKIQKNA